MLSRSLLARSDRPNRRSPASLTVGRIRDAARALVDIVHDSERTVWDRVAPLLLLATISTLPLVGVASGVGPLFAAWLALVYLQAGYMWVGLAADRADRSHYWRAFVVIAGGLGVVTLVLPDRAGSILAAVVAVGAAGALVAAIRLHAPVRSGPWYILLAALTLAVAGQLGAVVGSIRGDNAPVVAGLVSLAGMLPLPVAVWLLLHRRVRGSSRTSLLDTAIVTTGIAMLGWVFLIAPGIDAPASSGLEQIVVVGWPVVALAILVVAVRFLLTRWPDVCTARQLAGGALLLLIASISATSWMTPSATDPLGHPGLNILWLLALVGFGAAALHPTMKELAAPVHEQPTELDWQRGLLLTLSLLMAPVALVAQHARGATPTIEVLAGGTALLGLLVATRALVLQRAHWQMRANDRLLRLAATDLAVTYGREAIVRITVETARQIARDRAATALYLADDASSGFLLQSESGLGATRVIRERDLPDAAGRILAAGVTSWLSASEVNAARVPLGIDAGVAVAAIAPVSGDTSLRGLFVSAGNRLDHDTARCIETLAAMLAIALDRQQFADELGYYPGRTAHRAQASDGTAFTFIDVDPIDDLADDTEEAGPSITESLREAIEGDRLLARFQPRFDLVSGRITGVELTAAWESPHVGPIPRGALSAIAAEHDLSQPLRQAILVAGCRQAATWRAQHPDRALDIIVPLSHEELATPGLADDVDLALTATGCNAARLVLQLTAASLLEADPTSISALADLAAIGVQVAVSEAGTSWSDLDRIQSLPFSTIELEASLVQRIDQDERSASIAAHLIARAHSVGARTVAHGIDQRQQWIALRKLNGDIGQGNLFSPPLTPDEMSALLDRSPQRASVAA